MVPPVPGIADNGDFGKMIGRYGLGSGAVFEYAKTKFYFDGKYRYNPGYQSSEILLIAPAVALGVAISRDGSVDLRVMGALHTALRVLALFLAVPLLGRAWLGLVAAFLFCDFMYAGFLNSFYMDVAALPFTLLAAAFYLRAMRSGRVWDSVALAAAAAGTLLVAACIPPRYFVATDYAGRNPFNIIFSQIVPNSAAPDGALAELGLDASYRRFSGMTADWSEVPWGDAEFRREFTRRTGYPAILRFYMRHPGDACKALRSSLDVSGRFQSPLGNFDSATGMKPPANYCERFRLASRLKQYIFFGHGARLFWAYAGLALAVPALLVWKRRQLPLGSVAGGIVLAGVAETMLVASALADVFDQFRHELVAFALFDMLLLALLWAAAVACATIKTSQPRTGKTIST